MIAGIVLIGVAIGAGALIANSRSTGAQATAKLSTVAVTRGNLTQTVSGSGSVTANQTVDLAFQASGIVKEVKVQAGDTVKAGQTLATLDGRDLQSKVAAAQASLASAEATLSQKQKGNSTPAEIASAQAALDSAQKAYDKVTAGPAKSELASAQAAVASGQAAYAAALKDNEAGDSTLRSLKATLDQANVTLQQAQAAYRQDCMAERCGRQLRSRHLAGRDHRVPKSACGLQRADSRPVERMRPAHWLRRTLP